jgi:protoporphyrinogen oxidase
MTIAIIGGGLTGLTAALTLLKKGHTVTIFEKESYLGGLAAGFTKKGWMWPLERTYHHFFTTDTDLLSLTHELGIDDATNIHKPVTSVYFQNQSFPFDTPGNLLTFPGLPLFDKLRTGAFALFCKINPSWRPLEHITAKTFAKTLCGKKAYERIWDPLLAGKFGPFADAVAASWLWARVHTRTRALGYFHGGFTTLIDALAKEIKKRGGKIFTNTPVKSIKKELGMRNNELWKNKKQPHYSSFIIPACRQARHNSQFDQVLLTVPSPVAASLLKSIIKHKNPRIPYSLFLIPYIRRLLSIPHLWAQTLILETHKPILKKIYWLNMTDKKSPFVALVGHTNMIDKKHYGGHHITYIANYLPDDHPYLTMTKQQLLTLFLPYLKRINPSCNSQLVTRNTRLFIVPNAQPVHTLNYSKKAPIFKTPIPGIYLANLDSIYPWDRGANYAIKLGKDAANSIINIGQ